MTPVASQEEQSRWVRKHNQTISSRRFSGFSLSWRERKRHSLRLAEWRSAQLQSKRRACLFGCIELHIKGKKETKLMPPQCRNQYLSRGIWSVSGAAGWVSDKYQHTHAMPSIWYLSARHWPPSRRKASEKQKKQWKTHHSKIHSAKSSDSDR